MQRRTRFEQFHHFQYGKSQQFQVQHPHPHFQTKRNPLSSKRSRNTVRKRKLKGNPSTGIHTTFPVSSEIRFLTQASDLFRTLFFLKNSTFLQSSYFVDYNQHTLTFFIFYDILSRPLNLDIVMKFTRFTNDPFHSGGTHGKFKSEFCGHNGPRSRQTI